MSTAKKIETRRQRVVHMDGLIELSATVEDAEFAIKELNRDEL